MSADLAIDKNHWGYDADGDLYPLENPLPIASVDDVRLGTPHLDGAGTAAIPAASDVRLGVAVDHTTGTMVSSESTPIELIGSMLDQVVDAVVAEIDGMGLNDSDQQPVVVERSIPPTFTPTRSCRIEVFYDGDETEPLAGLVNRRTLRINIAIIDRSKSESQSRLEMSIRETIIQYFVGRRLTAIPDVYCQREATSSAVDMDQLSEFVWVTFITLEFVTNRGRS